MDHFRFLAGIILMGTLAIMPMAAQPDSAATAEQRKALLAAQYAAHKSDFDYLLGDWEFSAESRQWGKFDGRWSAVRLETGQILDEYRVTGDNGETIYVTTTIRAFNAATGKWELIGMDAAGGLQDFGTGQLVDSEMHIEQKFGVTSDNRERRRRSREGKAPREYMNVEPAITSPIVRTIGTADVGRSSAFYQDVLGFEVRPNGGCIEAASGPALVQFGMAGDGPVVLFFQTADIAAKRDLIVSRGGTPGEIQKVNWIKMRMFEIRDPDDNVLWFGQSYHEEQDSPSRRDEQPRGMRQALPELPFDNVPAAVAYYRDILGFRINYAQDDLGVMDRDAITILLIARTEQHKGIGSFGVYVDNADALHAELSAKGANVQGAPVSHAWGLREFSVLDLESNRIRFSQTFE